MEGRDERDMKKPRFFSCISVLNRHTVGMHILSRFLIEKGKKYLKHGQSAPKGAKVFEGKKGGRYYLTEDKHLKIGGQHHILFRSKGYTKDQHDQLEEHFKSLGAHSVHFINKPNNEKNHEGHALYNAYVNWGESTQKEIEDKKAADKAKFGRRKPKDEPKPEPKVYQKTSTTSENPDLEWHEHQDGGHWTHAWEQKKTSQGHSYWSSHGYVHVRPSGKYSATVTYVDNAGHEHYLTRKTDRELQQDVNLATAEELGKLFAYDKRTLDKQLLINQERRENGEVDPLEQQAARESREKAALTKHKNTLNLSFTHHAEAQAWAEKNLKTQITGFTSDLGLSHAAHVLAWVHQVENETGGALPSTLHLGTPANYGKWNLGVYYPSKNGIHVRKVMHSEYSSIKKFGNMQWIAKQEERGVKDPIPFSASEHDDSTLWHELGHALDCCDGRKLRKAVEALPQEEFDRFARISDYPNTYQDQEVRAAELIAEATAAIMTDSPRAEYVPQSIRDAILETYHRASTLSPPDPNYHDPIELKPFDTVEDDLYKQIGITRRPSDMSKPWLESEFEGKSNDEIFHLLKTTKEMLKDARIDPEKRMNPDLKVERMKIRQDLLSVRDELQRRYDQFKSEPVEEKNESYESLEWSQNGENFHVPFYRYRTENYKTVGKTRDGIWEIRPHGSHGYALYHVDNNADAHLIKKFATTVKTGSYRAEIIDTERSKKKNLDNAKETARAMRFYPEEYKRLREQNEVKAPARSTTTKKTTSKEPAKPKELSSDAKSFLKSLFITDKRPSEMDSIEKDAIVQTSLKFTRVHSPSVFRSEVEGMISKLTRALAKSPETPAERNQYARNKDFLNELEAVRPLAEDLERAHTNKILSKYQNSKKPVGGITAIVLHQHGLSARPSETPIEDDKSVGYKTDNDIRRLNDHIDRLKSKVSSEMSEPVKADYQDAVNELSLHRDRIQDYRDRMDENRRKDYEEDYKKSPPDENVKRVMEHVGITKPPRTLTKEEVNELKKKYPGKEEQNAIHNSLNDLSKEIHTSMKGSRRGNRDYRFSYEIDELMKTIGGGNHY